MSAEVGVITIVKTVMFIIREFVLREDVQEVIVMNVLRAMKKKLKIVNMVVQKEVVCQNLLSGVGKMLIVRIGASIVLGTFTAENSEDIVRTVGERVSLVPVNINETITIFITAQIITLCSNLSLVGNLPGDVNVLVVLKKTVAQELALLKMNALETGCSMQRLPALEAVYQVGVEKIAPLTII